MRGNAQALSGAILLVLALAPHAQAQSAAKPQPQLARPGTPNVSSIVSRHAPPARPDSNIKRPPPAAWYAPIASLAVPGLGQALMHQNRSIAYLGVELYSYIGYRSQSIEAERERDRFHAIARDVARAFFGGPRTVRPWDYYEAMEKFVESGAFDIVPGGDVDPEVDETTFNGSMWKLARNTFWSDPAAPPPRDSAAYINAISLYLRRAVNSDGQWSWRNAALEHDLYRRTISRSNDASRRAREQLGVLVANHLLSMADAFATVRVRNPAMGKEAAWGVSVSLPLPHGQ